MKRLLFVITFLLASLTTLPAQTGYEPLKYTDSRGGELNYQRLLPLGYDEGEKFPLVIFLHGAGERGDNNTSQLAHGSMMFTNPVNMEKYPAIVLFPQCPKELYWPFDKRPETGFAPEAFPEDYPITDILTRVKGLIDHYVSNEKVDPDRIYIIGLSMGGMGTFDLVCRYPDIFAAAIPVCGGVNPKRLERATNVKFRIFHGDQDDIVPCQNSRNAYLALKQYGADVEYIEFPGVNHGSWTPAFNYPGFMEWLFSQKK